MSLQALWALTRWGAINSLLLLHNQSRSPEFNHHLFSFLHIQVKVQLVTRTLCKVIEGCRCLYNSTKRNSLEFYMYITGKIKE